MKIAKPAFGCGTVMMACVLIGCGSPREHLYSLGLESSQRPAFARETRTILVGPISIPEWADRPQIVLKKSDFEVAVNEQERWAAPLKESLTRVLADDLEQRLPGTRFVILSAATGSAVNGRLTIDIRQLLLDLDRGVDIGASWTYRASNSAESALQEDSHAHTDPRQPGYPGVVDALNRATSALAADIAAALAANFP